MDGQRTMVITLPEAIARRVDDLVERGAYGSFSDAVRDSLETWDEAEPAELSDDRLRREVLPVLDRCRADPSRLLTSDQVDEALAGWHGRASKAQSFDP